MLLDYFSILMQTNVKILIYIVIYNYSLIVLFNILYSKILTNQKTLNSFSFYKYDSFSLFSLTLVLLSLAGVPPFTGFFTKIFILLLLVNSNFFLFFFFFTIFTLASLYFYLSNIRYLYSSKNNTIAHPNLYSSEIVSTNFFNITLILVFFLVFGLFFLDDIILFLFWTLI